MQAYIIPGDSTEYGGLISNTSRPRINKKTGRAAHFAANGEFRANSRLDSREWILLDTAVQEMQRLILTGIDDLRSRGLVRPVGSIGVQQIDERIQSERRLADVSMDTETRTNRDRVERKTISVPLPVIHTGYRIGERELDASRRLMLPLDVAEARESARAVAETLERILFKGTDAVTINGNSVKGYDNATGILSDTATNMGGGDFGTADNAYNTIKGTIAALALRRFYGPFMIYLHSTQFWELLTVRANTDTTQLDLINRLPQVAGVRQINDADNLAAGTMLVVQMTSDVVELAETFPIQNREWVSQDQSVFNAKIMAITIPFIKYNYIGQTGIAKITGC